MLPTDSPSTKPIAKPMRSRRTLRCSGCWLPSSLCLCAELPRIAIRTRVVVMMHRREAVTSSNTGRLAARVLEGASVRVRGGQSEIDPEPLPPGRRLVLFPAAEARLLTPEDAEGEGVVLLVPDGTWAQARRLLRRDDLFQGAEVVTLPPAGPSRYGLRRHAREGSVCTLEAIGRALGVLEGAVIEDQLAAVLDRFVARAQRARTGRFDI
jgi:DTW domain-containing protein